MNQQIQYDSQGRMKYHPEFHARHKKPWMTSDERYLIENYTIDGPEACSFALERPITAIHQRVLTMRKEGRMPPYDPMVKTHVRMSNTRIKA